MQPCESGPSRWRLYSGALLFLTGFFQVMQWPLLPRFLDIYYHLSVMKGFHDAGGYVTRAFWEYAPAGRPHLYPPLLHVWMLDLYQMGLSAISIARLVDCVSYPALLFTWYFVVSRLYSPRAAFWALLLFSSAYSVALASVTLSAFNIGFCLGLLALLEAERKHTARAGALLGLCFYAHTLLAGLFLWTFCLYALWSGRSKAHFFRAIIYGAVLASPFLAYQFQFREFFTFVRVKENSRLELDMAIYALATAGAVLYGVLQKKQNARLALCLVAGMLPLVLTHQVRFFAGHGLAGTALLAALFLDHAADLAPVARRSPAFQRVLAVCAVVFISFLSPFIQGNLVTGQKSVVWADRTLTRYVWSDESRNFRSNAFSIYFQEPYEKLAAVIREHSDPDDILWTDFSYTAGILGLMADRVTSCGMLAEVKPFEEANRLKDARVLVWFLDKDGHPAPEMKAAVERYRLQLLKETDMAFVYLNPEGYKKSRLPDPLIPNVVLLPLGLFAALLCLGVFTPFSPHSKA